MSRGRGHAAGQRREFWGRHLPWQRPVEILLWVLVFGSTAAINTYVVMVDAGRYGYAMQVWKPATWEGSSALVSLLLLPPLLWLCERWPLHADTWARRLPGYLAASLAWSLLHVAGMVLIRVLVYRAMGTGYDFDWPRELPYEYLKDVRTFSLVVFFAHGYSWLWRRLRGEARALDAPDPGLPVDQAGQGALPVRFLVRKLGREFLVSAADIEWAQASGNYVNLHVAGRDYPLRSTMAGIAEQLDPACFLRVHRSYIVNLEQIQSIEPLDTGDARLHMKAGVYVPCSRRYREGLRAFLPQRPAGP